MSDESGLFPFLVSAPPGMALSLTLATGGTPISMNPTDVPPSSSCPTWHCRRQTGLHLAVALSRVKKKKEKGAAQREERRVGARARCTRDAESGTPLADCLTSPLWRGREERVRSGSKSRKFCPIICCMSRLNSV